MPSWRLISANVDLSEDVTRNSAECVFTSEQPYVDDSGMLRTVTRNPARRH
jgi:hypothetical protein